MNGLKKSSAFVISVLRSKTITMRLQKNEISPKSRYAICSITTCSKFAFKKLEIDQHKVVTKFDDNALSQTAPGCVWGIKLGWLSILSNKFDEQV
jgi:hypothetical protein